MKKYILLIIISLLYTLTFAHSKNAVVSRPIPSTIVVNQSTNTVNYVQNGNNISSMASITKLMTAMVVLDHISNLQTKMYSSRFHHGRKEFTVNELLNLLLIRSDNYAAEILSRNIFKTRDEFIAAMNTKAKSIGMTNAYFADPSGLDYDNKATVQDIATMVSAANKYSTIQEISSKKNLAFKVETKKGTRLVKKPNTNHVILNEFSNIILSKTGTTLAAGKCVVLTVVRNSQTFIIVVLGRPNSMQRDREVRRILKGLQ